MKLINPSALTTPFQPYNFIKDQLSLGAVALCRNGQYSTLCDDRSFRSFDASVVCNQLGFSAYGECIILTNLSSISSYYLVCLSSGALVVSEFLSDDALEGVLSNFMCNGSESRLIDCLLPLEGSRCPSSTGDVGVVCAPLSSPRDVQCEDGDVRVVGGETVLEGRVEVCLNHAWGTVCSRGFTEDEAHTVCSQLGFPFNGEFR